MVYWFKMIYSFHILLWAYYTQYGSTHKVCIRRPYMQNHTVSQFLASFCLVLHPPMSVFVLRLIFSLLPSSILQLLWWHAFFSHGQISCSLRFMELLAPSWQPQRPVNHPAPLVPYWPISAVIQRNHCSCDRSPSNLGAVHPVSHSRT